MQLIQCCSGPLFLCTYSSKQPFLTVTLPNHADSPFLTPFVISIANIFPIWVIIIITSCMASSPLLLSPQCYPYLQQEIILAEGQLWVMLFPCLLSSMGFQRLSNQVKISQLSMKGSLQYSANVLSTLSSWMSILFTLSDSAKLAPKLFSEYILHDSPLYLSLSYLLRSRPLPFISAW